MIAAARLCCPIRLPKKVKFFEYGLWCSKVLVLSNFNHVRKLVVRIWLHCERKVTFSKIYI